jgi:hypothetical protein
MRKLNDILKSVSFSFFPRNELALEYLGCSVCILKDKNIVNSKTKRVYTCNAVQRARNIKGLVFQVLILSELLLLSRKPLFLYTYFFIVNLVLF